MSNPKSALERETLAYHENPRPGKFEIVPTKPVATQRDLSLAYTPGVAIPCLKIQDDPSGAYKWTNRGNLVAVITNGTAVLGLGNIGALAGKPVMEGKGILFKKFAGIDVFDIEVDTTDKEKFIETVRLIAPTFGGINLEDIGAPDCFEIEQRLKEELDIPVFHDDQHGTAIISAAALLNACEIAGKNLENLTVAVSGAGAAGIACIDMFVEMGVRRENVIFCDRDGVIYKGRDEPMHPLKEAIAVDTDKRTLADAMEGADVFLGLSVGNLVSQDMVRAMADNPIVFAMANPDPEISYPDAVAAREDVIMATGRSDYPNQVNNVLGFPFIFRGALDVRATGITDGMKIACAKALAALAKEEVPDTVIEAYGGKELRFGPEYLIPKPFDHRVLLHVAPAIAQAAIDDGVARIKDFDIDGYARELEKYLGGSHSVMAAIEEKAKRVNATVAFAEGEEPRAQRAAASMEEQGIAKPILVGDEARIRETPERTRAKLWARTAGAHALEAFRLAKTPPQGGAELAFDAARALEYLDRATEGRTDRFDLLVKALELGQDPNGGPPQFPQVLVFLAEGAAREGRFELAHRLATQRLEVSNSPRARRLLRSLPPDLGGQDDEE